VAGNVELGHHANAAIAGVGDELADFVLRVIHAVGAHAGEPGKFLALDAESLVVGKVPVHDIQLHCCHRVEVALEHLDRDEVAADVEHQASPREARLVFDGDSGNGESGGGGLNQLQESL
jgi:hypothetical protein